MKKVLLTLLLMSIIITIASYFFIPNSPNVITTSNIAANHNAVFRSLTDSSLQKKLIQSSSFAFSPGVAAFTYDGTNMQFQERLNDMVEVSIEQDGVWKKSILQVVSLGVDSSMVEWRMPLTLSYNPFRRIQQYIQAKAIKMKMASLLSKLSAFATQNENIYGYDIKRSKLTDSLLITTKAIFPISPSPEAYYLLIKKLEAYATAHDALITNYPMLNITSLDSTRYETMVALPINKEIASNGAIKFKRMVPGNILITDVKGGLVEINKGFNQLSNYMSDYELMAPAIPFQSLVTDRLTNKDSSQWNTKLYYPIF